MNELKFIVTENQILDAVKYALELNIQESKIVDILMHDVEDEIEIVLYDDCEEYKDVLEKQIQEPQKLGYWIMHINSDGVLKTYECSNCGTHIGYKQKFCEECGSKMENN